MKKVLFVVALFFVFGVSLNAQKSKLGHINSADLLSLMPEKDSIKTVIETFSKTLESQLLSMNSEFQNKYQEYMTNEATYSTLIKQTKQAELQDIQNRIQTFQETAQQELQKKNEELLKPILDKANNAIQAIGKEEGYQYIFDTSLGVVLFSTESDDILPLVKKKLNLK